MPAPKGPVMLRTCQNRWLSGSAGKYWRKLISTHPVGGIWRWWLLSVQKKWSPTSLSLVVRVADFGDQVLERARVALDDRCRESSVKVTTWPTCLGRSDSSSNHPSHKDGRSTLPHSAAPTPQAPLALVLPHLSMWPPT